MTGKEPPMFLLSPRRFHGLLLVPALLPFLFLFSPSASNHQPPTAVDANYTVHGVLYGSFPFVDPIYLVSNGSVSHGDLRTFGRFNGYSQDSFIYEPNSGYVGADSFTYHACDSSGNYDWRKSNSENSAVLKSYVGCIKKFYPNSKINILTHSMGGVLARRYILDNPNGQHGVDKLITIATPWLGVPKAIDVLETGQFGIPDTVVKQDTLKSLAEFFKSAHEILPARLYFSMSGDPFGEKDWDINGDRRLTPSYTYNQFTSLLDNVVQFQQSKPGATNAVFNDNPGQDDWHLDNSAVKYFHVYGIRR